MGTLALPFFPHPDNYGVIFQRLEKAGYENLVNLPRDRISELSQAATWPVLVPNQTAALRAHPDLIPYPYEALIASHLGILSWLCRNPRNRNKWNADLDCRFQDELPVPGRRSRPSLKIGAQPGIEAKNNQFLKKEGAHYASFVPRFWPLPLPAADTRIFLSLTTVAALELHWIFLTLYATLPELLAQATTSGEGISFACLANPCHRGSDTAVSYPVFRIEPERSLTLELVALADPSFPRQILTMQRTPL